ncbi:MAG: ABC transporter substrate-binding protein [Phycisphaerae bacterium]
MLLTLRSPDKLGGITTVSRRSYLGQVIELAGGDNIFADLETPYPQIGLEDIVSQQPDIIIEAMPGERRRRIAHAIAQAMGATSAASMPPTRVASWS